MEGSEKIYAFLNEAKTYYLATIDGDQPRVRPFGTILCYDGKLFIQTGKSKNVAKQINANSKVELSAFNGEKWIRVCGELAEDDRREVKTAMLDKMPTLRGMYNEDDGNMLMLYFKSASACICSFTEAPEIIEF